MSANPTRSSSLTPLAGTRLRCTFQLHVLEWQLSKMLNGGNGHAATVHYPETAALKRPSTTGFKGREAVFGNSLAVCLELNRLPRRVS